MVFYAKRRRLGVPKGTLLGWPLAVTPVWAEPIKPTTSLIWLVVWALPIPYKTNPFATPLQPVFYALHRRLVAEGLLGLF